MSPFVLEINVKIQQIFQIHFKHKQIYLSYIADTVIFFHYF